MPELQLYTGRSFITFERAFTEAYQERFNRLMLTLSTRQRFTPAKAYSDENSYPVPDGDGHLYPEWGVAIVPYSPDIVRSVADDESYGIQVVEPERYVRTTTVATAVGSAPLTTPGLQMTGAAVSTASGAGARVAVLDTGFDFRHPDFLPNRFVATKAFAGHPVPDSVNGHGTHVTGTACGPLTSSVRRYGIAYQSSLYIARVLDPAGLGLDQWLLDGIRWAQSFDVHVILMPLGIPPGPAGTTGMETVAKATLLNGTLIIAAAGNSNNNPPNMPPDPVEYPANCPSIFAVAAVDDSYYVPDYCCGGLPGSGGEVNVTAPGEYVYSATRLVNPSVPEFVTLRGTSMAAAHVAGLAALWCNSGAVRGSALWYVLVTSALTKATIGRYFSGKFAIAP